MSSEEPVNNTQSDEGGNVVPRKFKNPTTIEEMNEMRSQLKKDQTLKRRVKDEYKKKVKIEAQGQEYSPPSDLKQFKILQPKGLQVNFVSQEQDNTSTKDISDEVFVGEKE